MDGRLRQLRLLKAMTQRTLAEKAGVDKTTVYRLENHKSRASPTTIGKLARALDVNPEELAEQERLL